MKGILVCILALACLGLSLVFQPWAELGFGGMDKNDITTAPMLSGPLHALCDAYSGLGGLGQTLRTQVVNKLDEEAKLNGGTQETQSTSHHAPAPLPAPAVAPGQQRIFAVFAAMPHRPHRVKHPLGRQLEPRRGLGVARRAPMPGRPTRAPARPPGGSPHPPRRRRARTCWPHSRSHPL